MLPFVSFVAETALGPAPAPAFVTSAPARAPGRVHALRVSAHLVALLYSLSAGRARVNVEKIAREMTQGCNSDTSPFE